MRWLYIFQLIFVLTFAITQAEGQHTTPYQDNAFTQIGYTPTIPSSPSASSLGKYGEYEVNLAYGVPNIEVPLFNITSGHLQLPASLSYHAAGNKVKDEGSWVGLGWTLNLGGVITRTVRGLPDDETTSSFRTDSEWYRTIDETDYDKLQLTAQGSIDTEPDVYNFNFNGYSGQFYFDNDNHPMVSPYQPLTIITQREGCAELQESPISNSGMCFRAFEIETPDGTRYLFQDIEVTEAGAGRSYEMKVFVSSWYLTKITHPNKFDEIFFNYNGLGPKVFPYESSYYLQYESETGVGFGLTKGGSETLRQSKATIRNEKRLARVDFNDGRIDITPEEIKVCNETDTGDQLIYDIDLHISQYQKSSKCGTDNCDRKKLDWLTINGSKYAFEYDETFPQPPTNTYDTDHWGYYNAANNNSPVPSFFIGSYQYGEGANRNVNEVAAQFGILKAIVYPTKGRTEFTFESNRVNKLVGDKERFDIDYSKTFKINGANESFSPSGYSVKSDLSNSTASHFIWDWPKADEKIIFDVDNVMSVDEVTFDSDLEVTVEYVTPLEGGMPRTYVKLPAVILAMNGENVVNTNYNYGSVFIDEANSREIKTFRQFVRLTTGDTYQGNANLIGTLDLTTSGDSDTYVKVTLARKGYVLVEPTGESTIFVGGLRIKEIASFDFNNSPVQRKTFSYDRFDISKVSSAKLVNAAFADLTDLYPYYTTYVIGEFNGACETIANNHRLIAHCNPQGRMTSGYAVVYENVREKVQGGSDENNGRTDYTYTSTPDLLPGGYPSSPLIPRSNLRAELKKIEQYNSSDLPVKTVENFYGIGNRNNIVYAAVICENREYPWHAIGGSEDCKISAYDLDKFAVTAYQIGQESKSRVIKTITTEYDQNGNAAMPVVETFDYDYESKYELLTNKTTLTGIQEICHEYTYQYNISTEEGVPVNIREERSKLNGKVIAARKVDYDIIYPLRIYEWKGNTPDAGFINLNATSSDDGYSDMPDVTISYLSRGKRTESVLDKAGVVTTYLTDTESNDVIVKISNATQKQYGYGSADGTGNQIFAVPKSGVGLNGNGIYELSALQPVESGNFSPGKYILEFWLDSESNGIPNVTCFVNATSFPQTITTSGAGRWKKHQVFIDMSNAEGFRFEIAGSGHIDEVRFFPCDAQMTTYSYRRFVGLTSIIDPSGIVKLFEYYPDGKLHTVKDADGNILQEFKYNLMHK